MKTIIFDFDGVLADTFDAVIKIVNEQGPKYGIKAGNIRRLRDFPLNKVIKELKVPLYKLPFFTIQLKKELNKQMKHVKTFPGLKSALKSLNKKAKLGIVSSNSEKSIKTFLKKQDLNYFDFIFTDVSVFGKAHMLKHAIKKHNLSDVVYVGDQIIDVKASRKAKVPVAAVSWGYNSPKALKNEDPDFFLRTPKDLLKLKQ